MTSPKRVKRTARKSTGSRCPSVSSSEDEDTFSDEGIYPECPLLQLCCLHRALGYLEASTSPSQPSAPLTTPQAEPSQLTLSDLKSEYDWQRFESDRDWAKQKYGNYEALFDELQKREEYWYAVCGDQGPDLEKLEEKLLGWRDELVERLKSAEKASEQWKIRYETADLEANRTRKIRLKQEEEKGKLRKELAELKKKVKALDEAAKHTSEVADGAGATASKRKAPTNPSDETTAKRPKSTEVVDPARVQEQLQEHAATIKTLSSMLKEEEKLSAEKDAQLVKQEEELKALRAREEKFKAMEVLFQK